MSEEITFYVLKESHHLMLEKHHIIVPGCHLKVDLTAITKKDEWLKVIEYSQYKKTIEVLKIVGHENSYIGHARSLAIETLKDLGEQP